MSADSAAENNEVIAFLCGGEGPCCLTRSLIGTAALSGNDFSSGV